MYSISRNAGAKMKVVHLDLSHTISWRWNWSARSVLRGGTVPRMRVTFDKRWKRNTQSFFLRPEKWSYATSASQEEVKKGPTVTAMTNKHNTRRTYSLLDDLKKKGAKDIETSRMFGNIREKRQWRVYKQQQHYNREPEKCSRLKVIKRVRKGIKAIIWL